MNNLNMMTIGLPFLVVSLLEVASMILLVWAVMRYWHELKIRQIDHEYRWKERIKRAPIANEPGALYPDTKIG